MADKTIGELTQATALDDDSLLIAEQNGEAVSVPGSLFKKFARDSVASQVEAAEAAAVRAETAVANEPKVINGTWWVYDHTTNQYVDTGAFAVPSVGLTTIDGGVRLTVEAGNGTQSVDIMDGSTSLVVTDDGDGNVILSGAGI